MTTEEDKQLEEIKQKLKIANIKILHVFGRDIPVKDKWHRIMSGQNPDEPFLVIDGNARPPQDRQKICEKIGTNFSKITAEKFDLFLNSSLPDNAKKIAEDPELNKELNQIINSNSTVFEHFRRSLRGTFIIYENINQSNIFKQTMKECRKFAMTDFFNEMKKYALDKNYTTLYNEIIQKSDDKDIMSQEELDKFVKDMENARQESLQSKSNLPPKYDLSFLPKERR